MRQFGKTASINDPGTIVRLKETALTKEMGLAPPASLYVKELREKLLTLRPNGGR